MRKVLLTATLAAAVAAGGLAMAQPAPAQADLRFSEIAARLEGQGFLIQEMERERQGFEVKATDTNGRRVRLLVDSVTGQLLRQEERHRRHDGR